MKLSSVLSILMSCCVLTIQAQDDDGNLVPNGGFEQYSSPPLGWFYTGKDFTVVMKYWESPTAASPDVYGPKVFVPSQWKEKGFGLSEPHGGKSMIGLTLFGCEGGKPHCREFAQIQLAEPLVARQRYTVSFWTKHLPRSIRINNIGIAFTSERIMSALDHGLALRPQTVDSRVIQCEKGEWINVSYEFHADSAHTYLLIGNFFSDTDTEQLPCPTNDGLNFAYYYIDDVVLKKIPPILEVPVPEDDLSRLDLREGQTIELKNIYFDHDHADFLPRSYQELNTLVTIMLQNPAMLIKVKGHTDNVGTEGYNYELSLSRARAVADYLTSNGIEPERARYSGHGSGTPIDSNDTESGRRKNRRVEFLILAY